MVRTLPPSSSWKKEVVYYPFVVTGMSWSGALPGLREMPAANFHMAM